MSPFEPPRDPSAPAGDPLEPLFAQARSENLSAREMGALWGKVSAASVGAGASTAAAVGAKTVAACIVGGSVIAAIAGVQVWRSHASRPEPIRVLPAAPAGMPGPAAPPVEALPPPPPTVAVSDLPSIAGPPSRESPRARSLPLARGLEARDAKESAPPPQGATVQRSGGPVGIAPSQGAGSSQLDEVTPRAAEIDAAPGEAALLLRARRALASDPALTLALTDEHARRFPGGTLVPEREILAIEALASLGRSSEARVRLDALRARYPNAANVSRLDTMIPR